MTSDLTLKNGAQTHTINVESISWSIDPGVLQLKPATFRILKDIFDNKLIPNFIVFFGGFLERITLDVNFPTDTAWKSFRKFMKNEAYFTNGTYGTYIQWGTTGDPFYGAWEDTTNSYGNKGNGVIGRVSVSKNIPSGTWKGTVEFLFGQEIKA